MFLIIAPGQLAPFLASFVGAGVAIVLVALGRRARRHRAAGRAGPADPGPPS